MDTDRIDVFLADPPNVDALPIHRWLGRGGLIVYSTGSKFSSELKKRARERLRTLAQAGRARLVPAEELEKDERALKKGGEMKSNDPHILALARASGARLVYTGDGKLIADFKNKRLIDGPRGKIYTGASNVRLLNRSVCRG
ncbi:MAG: hypothetical protein F4X59_12820 [Holophagales bacterium]|nr:hypothetical protein [Holophagales bacterium]MYC10999.1 hypothetical protein [Holophagales bacterium]